jgi:ribonuclease P protein component
MMEKKSFSEDAKQAVKNFLSNSPLMLNKLYRLPASAKFRKANLYKSSNFSLRIVDNNLENSRFGFIVKKTVDKRAVIRNRIRRVFRSCIEEMLESIQSGHDMLFSLEKGIIDEKQEIVCLEIQTLLKEKKLLK